jgi:chromosome segregation ATPase
MNPPNKRNAGKGDLRGFKYPMEPLARRAQWQLDALNARLAKVQSQLASVRAELDATEGLHQQACEKLGRQVQVRLDSSRHQAGLVYLGQLQALLKKLQEELAALDKNRAELLRMCRAAEARLEGLRSHESGAIDVYVREQSHLHATEADRDWITREALNRAAMNPPAEPGAGA